MREPERTCVACRLKSQKDDFFKVVLTPSGAEIELLSKLNGRGAYICKNAACIEKAKKSRAFSRSFKVPVNEKIYEELLNELNEN
ncbi:MAG: YlxR family protein [Clostridia bacterium]|nr:YlxR family protein [Clostridia bacterium]